ncbi:hypothetical protein OUZ56_005523 [Daphnia magna]|uniref:Uncharacterized protein n=1 Tax=Daphnia magna TaxID=35525 RepID=A0ABQ9YTR1_9CRUS|nr:hypothetical protein OUZ56_005523 [Daphnia magna]
MPPKNSQGQKRSVSALSNVSNVSSPSTISIELYDSGEEGAEMQSTNEACSLTGTLTSLNKSVIQKSSFSVYMAKAIRNLSVFNKIYVTRSIRNISSQEFHSALGDSRHGRVGR